MTKRELEKIAKAIEADVGETLPELREALREAADRKGRVTTPEQASYVQSGCRSDSFKSTSLR